ncbi:SGNH/GDSL hydrolase family protein [Deinococcus malanensis]|uniref:SGNH/GDSL hydrolase family protein n=1 Tax=Deinococcus malanensis TaxID=1706855 RepID=UPI00363A7D9E
MHLQAKAITMGVVGNLMPLGDSITDGYNVSGGYRTRLYNALISRDSSTNFVGSLRNGPTNLSDKDHEGNVGYTIDQLRSRLEQTYQDPDWAKPSFPGLTAYAPKNILLMIGTNDCAQNLDLANAPQRLSALIDVLLTHYPNTTLHVASIPPSKWAPLTEKIKTYNSALPGVVSSWASRGYKVKFVDVFSVLSISDLADDVHPNKRGYDKISDAWYRSLDTSR